MKIQRGTHAPARWLFLLLLFAALMTAAGCGEASPKSVPHESTWGIYEMDLETQAVRLVYPFPAEMQASALRLSPGGDRLVFSGTSPDTGKLDVYTVQTDGQDLTRLTESRFDDIYPAWSPDASRIAFLSQRDTDLDIYMMDAAGTGEALFYDSGYHDADIDWVDHILVFTSQFAIWTIRDDGTGPVMVTDPPHRGEWGIANLPAGDFDPRLRPDGGRIVFERLEDTSVPNGGYNIFVINVDGTGETRLTDNYYAQGLANWSSAGDRLVYAVAAIDGEGQYDIWMMNADGSDNRDITPDYFPSVFLCHSPIFSADDAGVYFIGQWWE